MSVRVIHADTVPEEDALALAKLINSLPESSVLRQALAEILDTVSHGKNVYVFFYPTNEEPLPEDFDPDGGA